MSNPGTAAGYLLADILTKVERYLDEQEESDSQGRQNGHPATAPGRYGAAGNAGLRRKHEAVGYLRTQCGNAVRVILANITGFEKLVVIGLVAAVPLLLGYVIGRWWALVLSLAPVAFGYIAYRDKQWGLMVLYVPPVAALLGAGIGIAKLMRMRERQRPRDQLPTPP